MPSFRMSFSQSFTGGVRVVVHKQGTMPILDNGVNVPAGHHTTIRLQVSRHKLLGPPYDNCTPSQDWTSDDFIYSKSACEQLCLQTEIIRDCGCITGQLLSSQDMRNQNSFCRTINITNESLPVLQKVYKIIYIFIFIIT